MVFQLTVTHLCAVIAALQVIVVNRITDPQLQQIEGEAVAAVAAAAQFGDVQRIQVR